MKNLFSYELRKITRQKSYFICLGIMLFIIALGGILIRSASDVLGADLSPVFFTLGGLIDASFVMIAGVFIPIFACDDYANKTVKNIYARGYTRASVFFSKYLVSLIFTLISALCCFVFAFLFAEIFGNSKEKITGAFFGNIACQLLIVAGLHSVFFSVSMIIGKAGGSIAINLLGPTLAIAILTLIVSILKIKNFNIGKFWFEYPLGELAGGVLNGATVLRTVIMSLLYIGAFTAAGYFVNTKKEF